ncbi:MAG TPA: hypothetical protein VH351_16825 [Bryobacteraceae bacterium]|jgi:hypothetical protein|nr:hypothetical protein [Bryobacteraceae bacterium]
MAKKKVLPSKAKRVKAIARERVGAVQPSRPLDERRSRAKPKHKKPILPEEG